MKVAYFDCGHGASAAMMLSALSAAQDGQRSGASPEVYKLPGGIRLRCIHAAEGEIVGRCVEYDCPDSVKLDEEMSISELTDFINNSGLDGAAAAHAEKVTKELETALDETRPSARRLLFAKHKGVSLRVAAVFVALAAKLSALNVDKIYYSPVNAGGASEAEVRVPAPAVLKMAEHGGIRMFMVPDAGELLTLDGAAVLAALGECASPGMTPYARGFGLDGGGRRISVMLGEAQAGAPTYPAPRTESEIKIDGAAADEMEAKPTEAILPATMPAPPAPAAENAAGAVTEIECNIDDMTSEQLSYVCDRLLDMGALDVWQTPIIMKKGRMASKLSVLCPNDMAEKFAAAMLKETSTLGVRMSRRERRMLERSVETVETSFGGVRIKTASGKAKPEYEDCRSIAMREHMPIQDVYAEVLLKIHNAL